MLLKDFFCAIKQVMLHTGRLYASQARISFYSNAFLQTFKFCTDWLNVEAVLLTTTEQLHNACLKTTHCVLVITPREISGAAKLPACSPASARTAASLT